MKMGKSDYMDRANEALDNFINFQPPKPKKRKLLMKWFTSMFGKCFGFFKELVS